MECDWQTHIIRTSPAQFGGPWQTAPVAPPCRRHWSSRSGGDQVWTVLMEGWLLCWLLNKRNRGLFEKLKIGTFHNWWWWSNHASKAIISNLKPTTDNSLFHGQFQCFAGANRWVIQCTIIHLKVRMPICQMMQCWLSELSGINWKGAWHSHKDVDCWQFHVSRSAPLTLTVTSIKCFTLNGWELLSCRVIRSYDLVWWGDS